MTAAHPDIDSLLRHQDWVRALARSLVADPARAEDVAQQTMLEAIRSAPKDLKRPRGWLAQVARNAARAFARSDQRRVAREQHVARSEEVHASPADAAHRAAAHKTIVDAVFELDEPYHTVLVLRYFEDLDAHQIAARLDRPLATVRTHLQRGLDRMRDKLDRRFGDRSTWHAAILPLFTKKQVAAGVPVLTVLGSLTMWKLFVPVAIVCIALVLGVQSLFTDPPPPPPTDAGAMPVTATVRAEQPRAAERMAVANDATSPETIEGSNQPAVDRKELRARLLTPAGTALAGVRVAYVAPGSPRLSGSMLYVGNAGFEIDPPGRNSMFSTEAGVRAFTARFGEHADAAAALLLGRPVDRPRAVTDGFGWFTLAGTDATDSLELEQDGLMIYGAGTMSDTSDTVVVAGPGVHVRGVIVDGRGQGLEDAYVNMGLTISSLPGVGQQLRSTQFQSWNAMTDGDGAFDMGVVPQHIALALDVQKRGYGSQTVKTSDIHGPVRWQLAKKTTIKKRMVTGTVLHRDGTAAAGAHVVFGSSRTYADETGHFEVPVRYDSGKAALVAYTRGVQAAVDPDFGRRLQADPSLERNVVLRLGGEALSIAGRVVDERGEPLRNALVLLADGVIDGNASQNIESVIGNQSNKGQRTDRNGAFTIKGLSDRPYTLRMIDLATKVVIESEPVPAGSQDLVLRVAADALRRVEGTIVDRTGNPIEGVSVHVCTLLRKNRFGARWQPMSGTITTDASGRFTFDNCPRGHSHLWIDGETVQWQRIEVPSDDEPMQVVAQRKLRFKLRITSATKATHFVTLDADGNPLAIVRQGVDYELNGKRHPIVRENAPVYETDERAYELQLLQDGKEVQRVPLTLQVGTLNAIDI